VECAGCGQRIIGTLYKCTACPNVSVCATCEEKNVHNSAHILLKVRVPASSVPGSHCSKQFCRECNFKQWGCGKWRKAKRCAMGLIFLAVLRHLPILLCFLGMWATLQILRKKRVVLRACADCSHKEECHVGKKAKEIANGGNKFCGLFPKIFFVIVCLILRALPCWCLLICIPVVCCCCRTLRRLKKGACQNFRRGNLDSMCGQYKDILRMGLPQLLDRIRESQAPRGGAPQSMMGCAAVAASESLAASVAAVVALSESVAAELGVAIPVAIPVKVAPYVQQTRVLKEMGFEDTPALQQLLIKHSGNIQSVISEVMQLKPKQN